jgi:hypothetical protein
VSVWAAQSGMCDVCIWESVCEEEGRQDCNQLHLSNYFVFLFQLPPFCFPQLCFFSTPILLSDVLRG